MCSTPKAPKVEKIPIRAAAILPDNGDPTVRTASRRRRLTSSAMIFSNKSGTLGAPSVSGPIGTGGM